jgi:ribonucleoside-diphosphate reductase alpha chain
MNDMTIDKGLSAEAEAPLETTLAPAPADPITETSTSLMWHVDRILAELGDKELSYIPFEVVLPSNKQKMTVMAPAHWSETAVKILADKYFRRAGVPVATGALPDGLPFPRNVPAAGTTFAGETNAKAVFTRLAGAWTHHALRQPKPMIAGEQDARKFYEAVYRMLHFQWFAPNSPQWFNTGLNWAYGISKPGAGHYIIDPLTQAVELSTDSYANPQAHACFIQDVDDDLIREGGILDLWLREARVFKMGSGSGANYSKLRGAGEALSGGGISSGMMSFLHTGDRNAGSIKSGGTTRRAARMIVVDVDHPEIEAYIEWKAKEERKVAALVTGSKLNAKHARIVSEAFGDDAAMKNAMREARKAGVDQGFLTTLLLKLENGEKAVAEEYDTDWDSEAYATVSGQNANNTVRILPGFMEAVEKDLTWDLTGRVGGNVMKTVKARDLWHKIAVAAWDCADPGLHFADTINDWHTCLADGEIRASNPCSEYLFLDDTGCNLASIRLTAFLEDRGAGWGYNVKAYESACYIMGFILETTVSMAQYPSKRIAERTRDYRTLGAGYADLGGLLMLLGLPYDSFAGRQVGAALASVMTAATYAMSADFAAVAGPFNRFEANREHVARVMEKHRVANEDLLLSSDHTVADGMILALATQGKHLWNEVVRAANENGLRNAQASVIAPTGTIGIVMDCGTTGVEPDYALVKWKQLAGGGMLQFINQNVERALPKLGYTADEAKAIFEHVLKTNSVVGAPHLKEEHYPIFDCANGDRSISPAGHVLMMGAAQKFISGAISKTVNMPGTSSIKDVIEVHNLAYRSGVKAIALYRDGSKLSQPLTNAKLTEVFGEDGAEEVVEAIATGNVAKVAEAMATLTHRPMPSKRRGYIQKVTIGDHKLFLHTGEYADGTLGEIFIDMHKEGSAFRALMNNFAMAISLGLQYGVPLGKFVDMFVFSKYEPSGMVRGHDRLKSATSLIDFIFRDLAINYLGREDLAHVHPEVNSLTDIGRGSAEGTMIEEVDEAEIEAAAAAALPAPQAFRADPVSDAKKEARNNGYTGDTCTNCNSFRVIRTGTCASCQDCGTSIGGCV